MKKFLKGTRNMLSTALCKLPQGCSPQAGITEPGQSPRFSLVSPPRSQSFPGLASLTLPVGLSALETSCLQAKMFISWSVCTRSWKKDIFTKTQEDKRNKASSKLYRLAEAPGPHLRHKACHWPTASRLMRVPQIHPVIQWAWRKT